MILRSVRILLELAAEKIFHVPNIQDLAKYFMLSQPKHFARDRLPELYSLLMYPN